MLLRSAVVSAAALTLTVSASAQFIPIMPFSQSIGTYAPISGGTVLGTGNIDDVSYSVALPFAFPYDGGNHSNVVVNCNGWLALGTLTTNTYTPMSTTTANAGYIAACGRDLQGGFVTLGTRTLGSNMITGCTSIGPIQVGDTLVGTGIPTGTTVVAIIGNDIQMSANATATNSTTAVQAYGPANELRWEVLGSSPNQVFVAQWSNFRRFGTTLTTTQDTNLNFQIRLHENGDIQCVYGACNPGLTTTTAIHQVGLRGANNTFATSVNSRANVKGVNDDWSQSNASTTNAQGMLFNNVAPANVIPNGLTYTWNTVAGTIASNTVVGQGCGATGANSFYEPFADAALASAALQGNVLQLFPTVDGYAGNWIPGAAAALFVTPVTPTTLPTGDDGNVVVTPSVPLPTPYGAQSAMRVSGNAIIGFGSGVMDYPGTNSYTPTAGGFLNSTLGGFYSWHDYNEAEGGDIFSEEIGGVLYITYNNVESYSTPAAINPSTLQFQLDLTTGIVTIVWVTIDTNTTSTFGSGHLVGVSAPGASMDPGAVSLAVGPLLTTQEFPNMSLAALNRPVQGAGPNAWNLQAANIPAGLGIGIELIGLADANILDLSLFGLGLPGCQLRATLDATNAFITPGGSHAYSFTIPGGAPALNGFELYMQVAYFSSTLADIRTSNAIKGMIGNL
jgi:hypothetical protein